MDTKNLPASEPTRRGGRRTVVVIGAVVAVIVLVAVVALVVRGRSTGTSTATTTSIPAAPAAPTPDDTAAGPRNWPLVASDEFDGDSIDRSRWDVYHGRTTGDVGRQSPDAVDLKDGTLQITAHGNTSGGLSWDKGQTYGRWEIRAKAQPATGYGPVALLWPDSGKWPQDGEIDFLEIPKPDRKVNNFTVHYGDDNSQDATQQNGDFSQWHTYAVEWLPDHITGFIDGKQVFTTTNKAEIPTGPMHLAIQEDIGPIDGWIPAPDGSTPSTVKLVVDWVRIYGP